MTVKVQKGTLPNAVISFVIEKDNILTIVINNGGLKMKRVAIYIRVSTQEQADEGYSIPEQTERLKKYCEAMKWTIAKGLH